MCAHSFAHNARDSVRAVRPNPRLHGASPERTPLRSPLGSRSISRNSMPLCIAALRGLTALLSLCFPLQASLQTDFQAVTHPPPGPEAPPESAVRKYGSISLPFGGVPATATHVCPCQRLAGAVVLFTWVWGNTHAQGKRPTPGDPTLLPPFTPERSKWQYNDYFYPKHAGPAAPKESDKGHAWATLLRA